jgi:hypothetical protein
MAGSRQSCRDDYTIFIGAFPLLGRDVGKIFTISAEPNPFVRLLSDVR